MVVEPGFLMNEFIDSNIRQMGKEGKAIKQLFPSLRLWNLCTWEDYSLKSDTQLSSARWDLHGTWLKEFA